MGKGRIKLALLRLRVDITSPCHAQKQYLLFQVLTLEIIPRHCLLYNYSDTLSGIIKRLSSCLFLRPITVSYLG